MSIKDFVFFVKNRMLRNGALQQYHEAVKSAVLSIDALNALNFHKRKKLIEYAYKYTSFYKNFYDSQGFKPADLINPEDWGKVPVLEKEHVRKFTEDIRSTIISKRDVGTSTTGGSTGTPLKIYTDLRFYHEILGWRAFKWWSLSPAANVGIVHRRTPTSFWGKFKNRALWWPTKRIYLNASAISTEDLHKFCLEIRKRKIKWLQGYVGGLEKVADYIIEQNIRITTLQLVWSTSAPLSKTVRLKLEKAFNCKVMNQYGSCEVPNIAIQCPKSDHLHVNCDYVHLDIVDSNNQPVLNTEGNILVTNLESYAFPLIKYRIGDKGTLLSEDCNCSISLPLLQEIKGRVSDAVYTPDHLITLDGSYLTTIFDDYTDYINQFQLYQNKDYSIDLFVKVYQEDQETKIILNKVMQSLLNKTQNTIPIYLRIVDNISDDGGKIRYIISEIALKNKPIS